MIHPCEGSEPSKGLKLNWRKANETNSIRFDVRFRMYDSAAA